MLGARIRARIGSPMATWFDRVAKGFLPRLSLATHPVV